MLPCGIVSTLQHLSNGILIWKLLSGALQVGIEETFPSAKAQWPLQVDIPAQSIGTAANTVMFDQDLSSPNEWPVLHFIPLPYQDNSALEMMNESHRGLAWEFLCMPCQGRIIGLDLKQIERLE